MTSPILNEGLGVLVELPACSVQLWNHLPLPAATCSLAASRRIHGAGSGCGDEKSQLCTSAMRPIAA